MNYSILLASVSIITLSILINSSAYSDKGFENLDISDDNFVQIQHGHAHFPSLKSVLEDREFGDPLVCPNPSHTLVLRPNLNWACVYPETAMHLDWDVVLYSEPNAPQITKSISYNDNFHNISYQTYEGIISYVDFYHDRKVDDTAYGLAFSINITQKGDLTVTIPSIENEMFDGYCSDFNAMKDSHFYFFLVDGEEVEILEIHDDNNISTLKLSFDSDSELVEIILACHI